MIPHILVALIGVWVTAAPDVLGLSRSAAVSHWVAGPILASFALIAVWGSMRPLRWVNCFIGMWLMAAPLVTQHEMGGAINSIMCGAVATGLSLVRGHMRYRYGPGWPGAWRVVVLRGRIAHAVTRAVGNRRPAWQQARRPI